MGKRKIFKVDNRDFAKEIHNLMRKDVSKEYKKVEEIEKAQRPTTANEEDASDEVSEEGKILDADLKTLKGDS